MNRNGVPEHLTSAYLGDRVVAQSLAIESSDIVADMLTHPAPSSPQWSGQCCPNVPTIALFRLVGDALVRLE